MSAVGRSRSAGLIPAHAGKTVPVAALPVTARAHPRSRGENSSGPLIIFASAGSSPLTRGKLGREVSYGPSVRLIPAHAGKTWSGSEIMRTPSAHPRSRGENFVAGKHRHPCRGSSPLTRGKLVPTTGLGDARRLIPAHAGKTGEGAEDERNAQAHPRSRGENALSRPMFSRAPGSSPLTRGKHFLTCAFTAQIDQILETLELAVSSGSYLIWVACATDAPQDPVRSIGLVLPSSRGAS